ncbi:hypothetical protein FWH13_00535 [Candidatus Saccharibacteria bacterium]|nr:hypothetical protein [Candidatus Saccharibacteria bacterium]
MRNPFKPKPPKTPADYQNDIETDALSIGIAPAHAEQIAEQVSRHLASYLAKNRSATDTDVKRFLASKLQLIHPDLADFYRNRDKII